MTKIRALSLALIGLTLSGCATTKIEPKDYTSFYQQDPRSILVVPVINNSNEVDAAGLFYTTVILPLSERGFYVFPANATRSIMEAEGLGDAGLVHEAPTPQLAPLFGADSVLYLEVISWDSDYNVISSEVEVEFLYTLKASNGDVLWQDQEKYVYSTSGNSGNFLADLVATAVTAMINNTKSDFTPLAMQANIAVLSPEGYGLPFGPYSPNRDENEKLFPATGSGKISDASMEAVSAPGVLAPSLAE